MDFFLNTEDDLFVRNKQYFNGALSEYVYYSKYAKWRDDLGRREVWEETVRRTVDFLEELSQGKLERGDYEAMYQAILQMEVLPSMRLMAMAGPAARRDNICLYNCAAVAIDSVDSIVEIMYLSMNGVGIGFSVERQFVEKLRRVQRQHVAPRGNRVVVVEDSTEGWCDAFKAGLNAWWNGDDVEFDYAQIRPAGTPLKTKGGTASGHHVLKDLLDFTRDTLLRNQDRQLEAIDVYDIVTKIADCVVMGGMRRTAFLTLFDLDDEKMLHAKNGEWWTFAPHRANANNSAVWKRELTQSEISEFFDAMDHGDNGEPGIFSRYAVMNALPQRRNKEYTYLTNACGEAVLPVLSNDDVRGGGGGLCNLSSIVARAGDTKAMLLEKARVAAMIGTVQSMATDFHYLRNGWKYLAESERLLGVDLTGQFDCMVARDPNVQIALKECVVETNRVYAQRLEIKESVATTVVKPSGNSGALLNVSSGVHPRWSQFYVRNVRVNRDSPFFKVLEMNGVPMVKENEKTFVVGFPTPAPRGAITRYQIGAVQHLEYWKQTKINYAEHSVSCTVYYAQDEREQVKQWIFRNQFYLTGVSFLPRFDAHYDNAPFVEIDHVEFDKLTGEFPIIDYALLQTFDKRLFVTAQQEVACSANKCELTL